ncbi:MAG TPA: gas vesicle protein [Trebonia sp.]
MAATPVRSASSGSMSSGSSPTRLPAERVSLVDLLDRVLAGGVVVTGEITLSVADVDLVTVSLRALLSSVSALLPPDDDVSRAAVLTVAPEAGAADR